MAYDTNDLEKKSLEVIAKYKLVFIDEIAPLIGISNATFYNHELEKLDSIKDLLQKNKIELKAGLRKKWYENDNATTQIALYKLIGSTEESDRINSQQTKVSGNLTTQINVTVDSGETADELRRLIDGSKTK